MKEKLMGIMKKEEQKNNPTDDCFIEEYFLQAYLYDKSNFGKVILSTVGMCLVLLFLGTLICIVGRIILFFGDPDNFIMDYFHFDRIEIGSRNLCIIYAFICAFVTSCSTPDAGLDILNDRLYGFLSYNIAARLISRVIGLTIVLIGFGISYIQGRFYPEIYGDNFIVNRGFDLLANLPYVFIAIGIPLLFTYYCKAKSKKEYQMVNLNAHICDRYRFKQRETKKIYEKIFVQRQDVVFSNNIKKGKDGEKAVNYKLRWWAESKKARDPSYQAFLIQYDCQSKYSNSCIRLTASRVAQGEPQEFDHILVTSSGVIVIETKNYNGIIEVVNNGTWKLNGQLIESPNAQVERHRVVLFNILKKFQVPIHSFICIADSNATIIDASNSSVPVVNIRDLESYLDSIDIASGIPENLFWKICHSINNAKVGRVM